MCHDNDMTVQGRLARGQVLLRRRLVRLGRYCLDLTLRRIRVSQQCFSGGGEGSVLAQTTTREAASVAAEAASVAAEAASVVANFS
jgi:hypothetical protein